MNAFGGVDPEDVRWESNALSGRSHTMIGENYVVYVYESGKHTPIVSANGMEQGLFDQ